MKTAKEIVEKHCSMPTISIGKFEEAIKEYVREACKRQRDICAEHAEIDDSYFDYEQCIDIESIINAPEPKLK